MLKPKPWWLFFTARFSWVTLHPVIYYPESSGSNNPALLAHESVHLRQQAGHLFGWLLRYFLSRSFRFDQEVEAIREELRHYPEWKQEVVRQEYVGLLSSRFYLWAGSRDKALAALR